MQLLTVQTIRNDSSGDGNFGSSRTGHIHQGVDLLAAAGESVFAPFNGTVTRIVKPYRSNAGAKSALNGFDFTDGEKTVRVFYAKALAVGEKYKTGEAIAVVESVASYYSPSMKNHIHVELRNKGGQLLNPTEYLTSLKKK